MELASVSGLLDRLEKKNMINRALDKTNRRSIKVTTTKKSDAMKDKLQETVDALNKEINKDFTKKNYDIFMETLRAIGDIEEK